MVNSLRRYNLIKFFRIIYPLIIHLNKESKRKQFSKEISYPTYSFDSLILKNLMYMYRCKYRHLIDKNPHLNTDLLSMG